MTTREIQRALQTLHQEKREQIDALRDREPNSDSDWLIIFAAMESRGYVKPAPGRTTLTFASFTIAEQRQIEGYAQRLINEAHALCLRFQELCPMFRESDIDRDELFKLERWYRAQYRAVERLRRRRDDWEWVHGHIKLARSWLATTSAVRELTARDAEARTDEQIRLLLERKPEVM